MIWILFVFMGGPGKYASVVQEMSSKASCEAAAKEVTSKGWSEAYCKEVKK